MFGKSDNQNLHRIALAYASDFMLATMVLHLYPKFKVGLATSLDHSMWFHSPVSSSNWHLYDTECHKCMGGRSLNGSRLVWTVDQGGLVVCTLLCMVLASNPAPGLVHTVHTCAGFSHFSVKSQ